LDKAVHGQWYEDCKSGAYSGAYFCKTEDLMDVKNLDDFEGNSTMQLKGISNAFSYPLIKWNGLHL